MEESDSDDSSAPPNTVGVQDAAATLHPLWSAAKAGGVRIDDDMTIVATLPISSCSSLATSVASDWERQEQRQLSRRLEEAKVRADQAEAEAAAERTAREQAEAEAAAERTAREQAEAEVAQLKTERQKWTYCSGGDGSDRGDSMEVVEVININGSLRSSSNI